MSAAWIHPTWLNAEFWRWVAREMAAHERAIAKLAAKQKAKKEARNDNND